MVKQQRSYHSSLVPAAGSCQADPRVFGESTIMSGVARMTRPRSAFDDGSFDMHVLSSGVKVQNAQHDTGLTR